MIFQITFKDPDGVYESLQDEARQSLPEGLSVNERKVLCETRREEMDEFAGKWIWASEYVTLEFDTEKGTAVVVENKR